MAAGAQGQEVPGLVNPGSAGICGCWGAGAGGTWWALGRLRQPPGHVTLQLMHMFTEVWWHLQGHPEDGEGGERA